MKQGMCQMTKIPLALISIFNICFHQLSIPTTMSRMERLQRMFAGAGEVLGGHPPPDSPP